MTQLSIKLHLSELSLEWQPEVPPEAFCLQSKSKCIQQGWQRHLVNAEFWAELRNAGEVGFIVNFCSSWKLGTFQHSTGRNVQFWLNSAGGSFQVLVQPRDQELNEQPAGEKPGEGVSGFSFLLTMVRCPRYQSLLSCLLSRSEQCFGQQEGIKADCWVATFSGWAVST